ncbi:MAG: hypothetical protein ABL894_12250 [Hyphomicrobium sp.]
MSTRALRLPLMAIVISLLPLPAAADMGLAPARPGDIYVSGEGGYLHQDGGDVNVYGTSPAPGTVFDTNLSPANGWFAGGMIGWEKGSRLISFLPFTRVEGYAYGGQLDDSGSDTAPPLFDITLKSVDGDVNAIGGTQAHASVDRQFIEFGYRSEFDQTIDSSRTITWGLVSFIRNSDESSEVLCSSSCGLHRSSDVETWMFGNMLMMEPEYRFTSGVALVGRLGAGFYTYDADGKFRSYASGATPDPFRAYVSDDESGIGFRGALGAGLKFIFGPSSLLETYAEADYFSGVGTAHFSNSRPADGTPSRIELDSLWELRAGARLTIGLGSGN